MTSAWTNLRDDRISTGLITITVAALGWSIIGDYGRFEALCVAGCAETTVLLRLQHQSGSRKSQDPDDPLHRLVALIIALAAIVSFSTTIAVVSSNGEGVNLDAVIREIGIPTLAASADGGVAVAVLTVITAIPTTRRVASLRVSPRQAVSPGPGINRPAPNVTPKTQHRVCRDRILQVIWAISLVSTASGSLVAAAVVVFIDDSSLIDYGSFSVYIITAVVMGFIVTIVLVVNPMVYVWADSLVVQYQPKDHQDSQIQLT